MVKINKITFNQLLKVTKIRMEGWAKKQLYSLIEKHDIDAIEEIDRVEEISIEDFKEHKPETYFEENYYGYAYILRKGKKPIEIEENKDIEPKAGDYIVILEGERDDSGNYYWEIAIFKIR